MAAAFDFNLGSAGSYGLKTLTTSHLASANTRVVVLVSYWDQQVITAMADNAGHTYTLDKRVTNANDMFEFWSCPIAAGLASGVVITATVDTTSTGGFIWGASSISGVDMTAGAGAGLDTSASTTAASTTAWSSGAVNAITGGISLGGAGLENTSTNITATATTGTKVHDVYDATEGQGMVTAYLVVGAGAAGAVGGAIANTAQILTEGLAIYKTASVAAGTPDLIMAPPR